MDPTTSPKPAPTLSETLGEFDAGLFEKLAGKALREVALGVKTNSTNGQKGKVTIELTLSNDPESDRVKVQHKLTYLKPTMRGEQSEKATTSTPMYVRRDGALTISPEKQEEMFTAPNVTGITKNG